MSSSEVVQAAETDVMTVIGVRPTRVSQPYDQFHRLASSKLFAQFSALVKNLRSRFALGERTVCHLVQTEETGDGLNSLDGGPFLQGHAGEGGKRLPIHLAATA